VAATILWEYRCETYNVCWESWQLAERLDRIGAEGWELAAIERSRGIMVFKRPAAASASGPGENDR
jgi:hypothetical protein